MALASLALDDFTWSDLVAATRQRIPAASGGAWTLHAPVDPGVTLVELFGWLLEQRLFWLDQVPDSLVRAILRLLGDDIAPVRAAATVLQLGPQPWTTVADGSLFHAERRGSPLDVTADGGITVVPVDHVGLIAAGKDRSNDLAAGRAVRLLPADGGPGEAQLLVSMPAVPMAALVEPMSIFVDLLASAALEPAWLPTAPEGVPPPAALSFWYRNAANQIVPWPGVVGDSTGGLRRSGMLRLPVPPDWTFEPGSTTGGVSAYAVIIRTEHATFTAPPRLVRFAPNAIVARHRVPFDHVDDASWLPLPGNRYALPVTLPIAESIEVQLVEASGVQRWRAVPDLAFTGPGDRVFVVDRAAGVLAFGDGLTGRIPRPAAVPNNLHVTGACGGGPDGNLGSGRFKDDVTKELAVMLVAAEGGVEAETPAAARQRATEELHRITRAITRTDHETLAVTTPGVALRRAHAAVGHHPSHPCTRVPGMTTVYVVPDAPREEPSDFAEDAFVVAPHPDPGALAAARARLDAARLVTHEVCVRGPLYRSAALLVEVQADPDDAGALRERVAEALRRFVDPLLGGDDETGWPFGEPLRPSALLAVAQRALGQDGTVAAVAIGLDGAPPSERCRDVAIGDHALVGATDVVVRIAAPRATRGGLR